ncbi:MAG TPA: carboxypeptidase-like regulatory domain-containing protein, partial [Planctomycetota bacterium]|nr:carboxypeptidase-like regulatory domain-containing protein [Planctomycetota bacterium]
VKVFDSQVAAADPEGALERAAKTDGTGRYEVAHLKPGLKRVWVTKPGFASAGRHNHTLENARPETRIDFTLFPGHVIAGVVLASDTGAGIPAAVVTFKPTRLGPAAAKFDPARDIPLEAEELRKRIAAAGGSPEAAKVQAGSMTREEAEIMRSRRMADEAARRAGADPAHAGDGDVKRDPSMIDDIPPAQREWQKKQQEMAVAHQNLASTTVVYRTKADGTFRADGLAEGFYQITVHAPGYAPPPIQSAETGAENVVFNMLLNGRISGHVIDDETEKPIVGGFTVGIGVGADARSAPYHLKKHFGPPKWTDGAFTYGDLRPGRYVLIAEAPGYAGGRSEETTLAQSEQRDSVVIRLIKGATVKGRVIDAQGKPVADAVVTTGSGAPAGPEQIFIGMIDSALRKDSKSARTRADGTFELANLFDGRYVLKVTHPDFGPYASDAFDVPRAGEVTRPDVTLARGGSIVGRVLTNNGPDDKAKVSVLPAAGGGFGSMREAATDGDGRYEIHGLAPGEYRVVLAQQGGNVNLGALLQLAQQKAAAVGGGAPGMPAPKTYVLAEGQRIVVDFP